MWSAHRKFGRAGGAAGRSLEAQIAALFPDVWYDPSDLTTLFQDSAGTQPVTALEQPVGLMKDKSGNNRHAYHTPGDTTTRPVVSRRINLLTKTEQFDDAVWAKAQTGTGSIPVVTPNQAVAPNGTTTADLCVFNLNGGTTSSDISQLQQVLVPLSTGIVSTNSIWLRTSDGSTVAMSLVNSDGAVSRITVASTWAAFTVAGASANANLQFRLRLRGSENTANAASIYIWGASLVPADLSALPYQRVNTTTDYDSDASKFPTFLRTDGVNDSLQTNAIDFAGTDKMFVGAAVRKLATSENTLAEFGSTFSSVGGFGVSAPSNTSPASSYGAYLYNGSGMTTAIVTGYTPPITNVVSAIYDRPSSSTVTPRINGAAQTPASGAATGNFGNHKLYLFMRGGTSLPFLGWFFGSLAKGSTLTASQIALADRWLASKTKTVVLA